MAGYRAATRCAWLLIWACIVLWRSSQIALEKHLATKKSATLSSLPAFGCAFTGLIISGSSCFLHVVRTHDTLYYAE